VRRRRRRGGGRSTIGCRPTSSTVTAEPADRQRKLQQHRLRMTLISVASSSLMTGVIALLAAAGEVAWRVVAWYAAVGVGHTLIFVAVIRRGWNLRWTDHTLLLAQIAANIAIHLGFVVAVPELWLLFTVAVLVSYNFAMVGFSSAQFTAAWLLVGAAMAGAFFAVHERFRNLGTSSLTVAILWLFFFLCLRQLTAVGQQFSRLRQQLSEKNRQLSLSLERIEELASHDELTGVLNRRAFMRMLTDEHLRARRNPQPFSIALIDIDHFKSVNDRHGHLVGDAVLKELSGVALASVRQTDRFARWGGEEFVLLLTPATAQEPALLVAERLRLAVERHAWQTRAGTVTVSIGIATFQGDASVEQLVDRADRALYRAKHDGRNCTRVG
jgi:diguanylate cyclase